jgi:hypothetical protein
MTSLITRLRTRLQKHRETEYGVYETYLEPEDQNLLIEFMALESHLPDKLRVLSFQDPKCILNDDWIDGYNEGKSYAADELESLLKGA